MRISNPTAKKGENLAAEYLNKSGYKIIDRNFRKGYGEIDIVCIKDDILVFVEVKTRTTKIFGGVKESITGFKIRKLIQTAQFYKSTHSNLPEALRIDAVLIDLNGADKLTNMEHIENIS